MEIVLDCNIKKQSDMDIRNSISDLSSVAGCPDEFRHAELSQLMAGR
jgi:hypothetical protein